MFLIINWDLYFFQQVTKMVLVAVGSKNFEIAVKF